jgi:SAM domain (Sterile alpha motif)
VNIVAWLHNLGLEQYEQAFRDNAIDAGVLPELTAEDLREIGVGLVGHRRKLLAAIAALRADGKSEPCLSGWLPLMLPGGSSHRCRDFCT